MNQQDFFNRYRYEIDTDELGGGGFGTVYKAFDDERDRYVAIKVSPVKKGLESLSLLKEVQLAEQLPGHRNIGHYESCHRFKTPHGTFDYGILQYYPEGNLSDLIKKHKLNDEQKESIAQGIVSGLDHLHQHDVVHRDLKSSNILMAKGYKGEYVPKIADFGLSKQFDTTDQSYFSNSFAGGSLLYVAPEQLTGGQIRKNVDLWGLGVVLFELFIGKVPFRSVADIGTETARAEIVSRISKAQIPKSIDTIPKKWRDVVKACLVANPTERIKSTAEVDEILGGKQPTYNEKTKISSAVPKNPEIPKPGIKLLHWVWYLLGGVILTILGIILWPVINGQQSIPALIPFEEEGNYGYKDKNGFIVIPARYDFATVFRDDRAKVSVGDSIYYINEEGDMVELIKPDSVAEESKKRDYLGDKNKTEETEQRRRNIESEDNDWNTAKRSHTITSYRKYLDEYSKGRYITDAQSRIKKIEKEDKEWNFDRRKYTIEEYEQYLLEYPRGKYRLLVEILILNIRKNEKEDKEWKTAKRSNTITSYQKYLDKYPKGRYVKDAKSQIQRIEKATKPKLNPIIKQLDQNMVYVKGGTFMMGCTSEQGGDCEGDEKPAHEVALSDFYIGKYEVTQEEWRAVMGSDPEWLNNVGCDGCPVETMRRVDRDEFLVKLNKITDKEYRLPRESEWEYASRGGVRSKGYVYSGSNRLGDVGWYRDNSSKETYEVGQKQGNELGLYDMSGNVGEFCADYYDVSPPSIQVLRGGACCYGFANCRVSSRVSHPRGYDTCLVGFRLARAL